MKTIYLAGGRPKNTAVNVMKQHLEGLGHRVTRDAQDPNGWDVTLRWGMSFKGERPALNAEVNQFDKYAAFERFDAAKVLCPSTHSLEEARKLCTHYPYKRYPMVLLQRPWLARKVHHVKGKDIIVCKTEEDVRQVLLVGEHDFFSVFIPTEAEFRVWVFQDKVLGVYLKQYKGEGEYQGYMRNQRFGFQFVKMDDLRGARLIETPCIQAVKALGLDFGGVDLILGKDKKYYVLEVNSMPAIETEKRSSGIRLANAVSKWAENQ